jgi:hypothetical protein
MTRFAHAPYDGAGDRNFRVGAAALNSPVWTVIWSVLTELAAHERIIAASTITPGTAQSLMPWPPRSCFW